jgi:transcriptional/translational regulatory protein YebC/TACO1
VLYAVVKQAFVIITAKTDLNEVRGFLTQNGFNKTKNNDYLNPDLGIILEDLHDENVLTKNEMLYFIDTVFFITFDFWL